MVDRAELSSNLKRLIVESLNLEGMRPEGIADDAPLFGQGLGLDSVDALELVVAIEKEYGISIKSHKGAPKVMRAPACTRCSVN